MGKKCEKWENREEKIKGGRGEEEGGKMLKLEATVSEITYASCLKFFCVFDMFHCSLTTVMPKLFFVCVCVCGYFLKRSAYFILAVSPGQTITTPGCETLTGKLPDLAQPQSPLL